jgi:hypothetical protein
MTYGKPFNKLPYSHYIYNVKPYNRNYFKYLLMIDDLIIK